MANSEVPGSPYRGTSARQPDLDWSQIRETVLALELMTGLIMAAMRDSDQSVEVLGGTFTSMAGYIRTIGEVVEQLPATGENAGQKAVLGSVAEQVGTMVNQAVVAFQFYDKLVQRLSHVVNALADVSNLIADNRRLYNPGEWAALQERCHAKFSTAEERQLFEAVMKGMPVEQALESYLATLHDKGDDIELF
jgi:hypothetical protein